ncbi:MAG: hypothetical protein Q9159_001910 [Coniocarpon cinnabarinum]
MAAQRVDVASTTVGGLRSVQKGDATPSDNSEEPDPSEGGVRQTRRSRREQHAPQDQKVNPSDDAIEDEEGEEEVTRCLCGKAEYPGPPAALGINDPDVGSLFILCDSCHVWQHGGCVGIMNDNEVPDNYFCEQCRPNLHKVFNGSRAQKYSRYLPVVEARAHSPPRKRPSVKDSNPRSSKEAAIKQAILHANGKRRATMNSRAAYEEDEMLRRALEESRGAGGAESSTSGQRKSKRAREESDESDHDLKRRKTGSDSPPPSGALDGDPDSDMEPSRLQSKNHAGKSRPGKGQQEQELESRRREHEREQERQAAASRRRGRADRRNADDSIPVEPSKPLAISKPSAGAQTKSQKTQTSSRPQNGSPQRPSTTSHKKGARTMRRGKVGRNQYTRERDAAADARAEEARALHSRDGEDTARGGDSIQFLPNGSKPARPRHMNPNRTSMNELRKRAAGILEYISRTQVEMAGEQTPSGSQTPSKGSSRTVNGKTATVSGNSKLSNEMPEGAEAFPKDAASSTQTNEVGIEADEFKKMSSLQMMDILTREIVHWQHEHGKWGEK